jgi:hypothetical protein
MPGPLTKGNWSMLDLSIPYRQSGIGWCNVYLFANIFKNAKFLKFTERPEFRGCELEQVDEMLDTFAPELSIGFVAGSNPSYARLPKDYVWELVTTPEPEYESDLKIHIACYLLIVRLIDADIWHSVAVLNHGGKSHWLDPYHHEMSVLTGPDHMSKQFIDCCRVERFRMRNTDNWAVLNGEALGYKTI